MAAGVACASAGGDVVRANHIRLITASPPLSTWTCMPPEPATSSDLLQASTSTRIRYTAYTTTLYPAYSTLHTRQRYTYICSSPLATSTHALEKHRPYPSRVILLRCCISPRHLGNGTTRQYRLDAVTRVTISQT